MFMVSFAGAKPLKLTPAQRTGAKAAPAETTGATTGMNVSNNTTDAPASGGGGKPNELAGTGAVASSSSGDLSATPADSGLPATPAVRSESTRTKSSSRYNTRKR